MNEGDFDVLEDLVWRKKRKEKKGSLNWKLVDERQNVIDSGKLRYGDLPVGKVDSLGLVSIGLQSVMKAGKYTLKAVYQLDHVFSATSLEESGSKSNAAVMQLLNQ